MTGCSKLFASAVMVASGLWAGSASAADVSPTSDAGLRAERVQWRGDWHRGRDGGSWEHRGWGPGFSVGIGIGAPYYDYGYYDDSYVVVAPGRSDHDEVAYCQQRFRSYDPASGTYLGYDGRRHPCP